MDGRWRILSYTRQLSTAHLYLQYRTYTHVIVIKDIFFFSFLHPPEHLYTYRSDGNQRRACVYNTRIYVGTYPITCTFTRIICAPNPSPLTARYRTCTSQSSCIHAVLYYLVYRASGLCVIRPCISISCRSSSRGHVLIWLKISTGLPDILIPVELYIII